MKKIFFVFCIMNLMFSIFLFADEPFSAEESFVINSKQLSSSEISQLQNVYGIYDSEKNYNIIIDGFGTGLIPPTENEWQLINKRVSKISSVSFAPKFVQPLPARYDNSEEIWFPPIGNQGSKGSCALWSVGYYAKTFQVAKKRNWDLSEAGENGEYKGSFTEEYAGKIFSPDFLYHLINKNMDWGSWFWGPIRLMHGIGAATFKTMPYNDYEVNSWPSEIAWREAALYRNETDNFILFTDDDEDFNNLKTLLKSNILGVIALDAMQYSQLSDSDLWTLDNYHAPISYNHANTVIGYDDNFGPYVEEEEIRYGAFKIANSWGIGNWAGDNNNDGCLWMSYKAFRQFVPHVNYFIDNRIYEPQLLAAFKISHNSRFECDITIGIGDPAAPIKTKSLTDYIFGGLQPFPDNKIVIDITEFKEFLPNNTFYLEVFDKPVTDDTGIIESFQIEILDSYSPYKIADTIYFSHQSQVSTVNDSSIFLFITPLDAVMPDYYPPQPPVWSIADTSHFDKIKIVWEKPTLNTNNEPLGQGDTYLAGYKIYRSFSTEVADWNERIYSTVSSNEDTYFIDVHVNDNNTYHYRIKAFNYFFSGSQKFILESEFSPILSITPPVKPYSITNSLNLPLLNTNIYRSEADFADINNNGYLDIALVGYSAQNHFKIYRNTGDTFILIQEPLGAGKGLMRGNVKFFDYNNNGLMDIIALGSDGTNNRLILFKNVEGEFIKVSEPMGRNRGLQSGYVIVADLNNNGYTDFIVSGNDGVNNRLIIFWNDNGVFSRTTEPLGINKGLTNYSRIAVADYNNDGYLDFAVAGYDGTNSRLILFKNNNGTFTIDKEPSGVNKGFDYPSLAFADYNNNGFIDLAVGGFENGNSKFKIFKNNNGLFDEFIEPLESIDGLYYGTIKFGDYNNNGLLDIAVQGDPGIFSIFKNTGDDSFAREFSPLGLNIGNSIGTLEFIDFNNNGKLDFFAMGYSLKTTIFLNNLTDINFPPSLPTLLSPKASSYEQGDSIYFQWAAASDNNTPDSGLSYNFRFRKDTVHGNSVFDFTGSAENRLFYILNTDRLEAGTYYWSVQTVDNGKMKSGWSAEDTFVITLPANADTVPPNPPLIISADTQIPQQVKLIWEKPEFNSDGSSIADTDTDLFGYRIYRSDIIDPVDWKNNLLAVIDNKNETSYIDTDFTSGNIYYYRITAYDSSLRNQNVHNNESDFSAQIAVEVLPPSLQHFSSENIIDLSSAFPVLNGYNFALGDFNNNGYLDAALIGNDGYYNRFIIYKNENNNFVKYSEPLGNQRGFGFNGSIHWCDYNNDGKLDLIGAGYEYGNKFMTFKNINNTFVKDYDILGGDMGFLQSDIKTADFNNDGRYDLAVTGIISANNSLSVFENIDGIYRQKYEPMSANHGLVDGEIEWFDFDNDGKLDLIVSGYDEYNPRLILFRNEGNGFTNVAEPMGINQGLRYSSIAVADINNNGLLDFAVAGFDGTNYRLIIFENQNGTFVQKQEPMGENNGIAYGQIRFADYDNDGFVDLVVSGYDGTKRRLMIFKNYNGKFALAEEPAGINKGFRDAKLFWNDWNKNGALDLIVFGRDSNNQQKCYVYLNQIQTKNIRPVAPEIISPVGQSFLTGSPITFNWQSVITDTTPPNAMTYNLRIGKTLGGNEVMSADSVSANVMNSTLLGNVQNHTEWTIKNENNRLTNGMYYWSVQAVDGGMMRSEWATEQTFTISDTIYTLNSSDTQIIISNSLTETSPVAVITIGSTEALNIQFNIESSSLNILTNLYLKINPDYINPTLTIKKTDKNQYYTGTDLITDFSTYDETIIDLILRDSNGNIISSDSTVFAELPILNYSVDRFNYSAEELKKLRIMNFNFQTAKWKSAGEPFISVSNTDVTVSVNLEHFSVYGLFFVPSLAFASNVANVVVYPNPYSPNDNNALTGTLTSGILFGNLPPKSEIEIYTISGRKIFSESVNTTPFKWDVRDSRRHEIASGIYLYVIKSSVGIKTGKFAIIK